MFDLPRIQAALLKAGVDGWLLYDFRGSNPLAKRILDISESTMYSRRFLYWIPTTGVPRKLVHRIELGALDHLPGEKTVYLRWEEFEAGVTGLVRGTSRIAMEYSPRNACPYISRVDAGTLELVRSTGTTVISSGDLVQQFESLWDESQWAMHLAAGEVTNAAYDLAWKFIAEQVRSAGGTTENAVQQLIMDHFLRHGCTTYHPPIVGVNANSGDPHYETGSAPIRAGDFVLVDLWAKLDQPRAVYSDLTRTGFVGASVPERHSQVFDVVAAARDRAIALVRERVAADQPVQGWEVDDACRKVIIDAGFGDFFVHRTGHSIGQEVHGNGANIDNLETREERHLLPGSCFSIEPGIYLPEFGVRSEVNVFIDWSKQVHVTAGELQRSIVQII